MLMPEIEIKLWEGKTDDEAKEKLIKDVSEAVQKNVGCPMHAVSICIIEVPRKNWGLGGVVSSKLDL